MIQGISSQTSAPQDAVRRSAAASSSLPNAFAALLRDQVEPAVTSTGAATSTGATQPAATTAVTAQAAEIQTEDAAAASTDTAGVPIAYGRAAIEQHMNQWWMGLMQQINSDRTAIYNQAMADWKVNAARHQELGLADLPAPEAPQLEAVEGKPDGWWFEIHG